MDCFDVCFVVRDEFVRRGFVVNDCALERFEGVCGFYVRRGGDFGPFEWLDFRGDGVFGEFLGFVGYGDPCFVGRVFGDS